METVWHDGPLFRRSFALPERPSDLQRFERCGEGSEKWWHCLDGLISHVGEAEGLALDLSITAIDLESMFIADTFDQRCYIDVPVVFDAGQGDRSIAFFGEELESVRIDPIMNEAIGLPMTLKPVFKAFAENVVQL